MSHKRELCVLPYLPIFSAEVLLLYLPCLVQVAFGYFQKSNLSAKAEDNRYHPQSSYYVLSTVVHGFSHESLMKSLQLFFSSIFTDG